MSDPVNNPSHYNQNGIEVIDVIETYAKDDFRLANVIKYVCRCDYKGKKLEDLKKAAWYLNRVIEELAHEAAAERFVQPGPDRIAGDDDASKRIKARYYNYDANEARCKCANPSCQETIKACDVAFLNKAGNTFCSIVCQVMHDNEERCYECGEYLPTTEPGKRYQEAKGDWRLAYGKYQDGRFRCDDCYNSDVALEDKTHPWDGEDGR